jgi:hypothetical protein
MSIITLDDLSLKRKAPFVSSSSFEEEKSLIINEIESDTFDTFDEKGVTNSLSFYDEILEIEENNNEISSEVSTENYFQETTNKLILQLDERDDVNFSLNNNPKNSVGLVQIKPLKACGCDGSCNTIKGRKTHTT